LVGQTDWRSCETVSRRKLIGPILPAARGEIGDGLRVDALATRFLPYFAVNLVVAAAAAVFPQFHPGGMVAAVFDGRVVALAAIGALESDNLPGVSGFAGHRITPIIG
jgi:hypothetical protein